MGTNGAVCIHRPLVRRKYWPTVTAHDDDGDDDDDDCEAISGMNEWQGKPKYSEKTWPSAALSTRYQLT
jgi:hypothetical protein